ncbi:MAG: BON domain-containing protein [Ramlibacter sp.]
MKPAVHAGALAAVSLALAFVLTGCGERSDDRVAAQKADPAVARSGQLPRSAATGGDTAAATGSAAADAGTGVMGAAADAREKAYGSSGEPKVDDNKLTTMVLAGLKADKELNPLRIDVDTRDGVVTLSGSVPSAAAKARASEIAQNVKDVRSVNNQLTLSTG